MKRIHLLCHEGPADALAPLFEAARREGLRVGWLDLGAAADAVPPALGEALDRGAFRAAAVAPGRTVTAKARSGPPILRDLLREHFLGCALVVVVRPGGGGEAHPELEGAPRLEAGEGRVRVVPPSGDALELSAEALAARLRRPRPWG